MTKVIATLNETRDFYTSIPSFNVEFRVKISSIAVFSL